MSKEIGICYIDDKEDIVLSDYLFDFAEKNLLIYQEYRFLPNEDNYKTLLANPKVNDSDIIVIDSKLFENMNIRGKKFTGEHFKTVLKKEFPYKKTVVISQKDISSNYTTISKYKTYDDMITPEYYYDKYLQPILKDFLDEIVEDLKVIDEIHDLETVDSVLVSKIQKNVEGLDDSTLFEKKDIDDLIKLFKEVKENYD